MNSRQLIVDFVYLWVDGNDPAQRESLRHEMAAQGKDISRLADLSCRYVDSQELRFSIRSLMDNAPWIRKIHIVTNGQIPAWLDTEHPKIQMVFHSQIMSVDALPTFNSEAIETCLADIPDLAEHFLYGNDDFFIGRPVEPEFFFTKDGAPIVYGIKHTWKTKDIHGSSLYLKNIHYSAALIKEHLGREYSFLPSHNISPYRKSWLEACRKEFAQQFAQTCRQKFRKECSVQRIIADYWGLACGGSPYMEIGKDISRREIYYCELLSPEEMKEKLSPQPTLFCINDSEGTLEEDREQLGFFLHSLFPQKAPWEKDDFIPSCPEIRSASLSLIAVLKNWLSYTWQRLMCSLVKGEAKKQRINARSQARRRVKKTLFMRRMR